MCGFMDTLNPFSGGPRFQYQHPHGVSPLPGNLLPLLASVGTACVCTDTHAGKKKHPNIKWKKERLREKVSSKYQKVSRDLKG